MTRYLNSYLVFLFTIIHQHLSITSPRLQNINSIDGSSVEDWVSDPLLGPHEILSSPLETSYFGRTNNYATTDTTGSQPSSSLAYKDPPGPPGVGKQKFKEVSSPNSSKIDNLSHIMDDGVPHQIDTYSNAHSENIKYHQTSSILQNQNSREEKIKDNMPYNPMVHAFQAFPSPIKRPKEYSNKMTPVILDPRQDSRRDDLDEEIHLGSTMGSSTKHYSLWEGTTGLNNILNFEDIKQPKESKKNHATRTSLTSMYPKMSQPGSGNQVKNPASSLVTHNVPEFPEPWGYRSPKVAQMGSIALGPEFIKNDGVVPQFNLESSTSQMQYWRNDKSQDLTNQDSHPWGLPQIHNAWPNFHNYHPFAPMKKLVFKPLINHRNSPQNFGKGTHRPRNELYDQKLKNAVELLEKRILQPQTIEEKTKNKQEGILNFFETLREKLTARFSQEKFKSSYFSEMPDDFVAFVAYAVKVPEVRSQVKEQLEAWMMGSNHKSSLYYLSNYALKWIYDQRHPEGNKDERIYSKALQDWHYVTNSKHYEMRLNKSWRYWPTFTHQRLVIEFDKERQKIEETIQRQIMLLQDNWFMPEDLADYAVLAFKRADRAPIIKSDLERWIASGDGGPISKICQYSLLWLDRAEIFAPKNYKLLVPTDSDDTGAALNVLKELDYRKRLDTAFKYWEDLMHMPWKVQENDSLYEQFTQDGVGKRLDHIIKSDIMKGYDPDHMDKQFATFVASALRDPKSTNTVKFHLKNWMSLQNGGSSLKLKLQVSLNWLEDEQLILASKNS